VLGSGDERDTNDKRWGRFPNPTVHIGLGQLRRVVNALIAKYGPPAEIAIEMTRDFKLSPKKLAELEKEQAGNQKKNEQRAEEIRKLGQAVRPSLELSKVEETAYDALHDNLALVFENRPPDEFLRSFRNFLEEVEHLLGPQKAERYRAGLNANVEKLLYRN